MHELHLWRAVFVAVLAAAAHDADALGFGRMRSAAILGQPLQVTVPIRADDGESITAECLSAEVLSGETRLPSSAVQVRLEGGGLQRSVRISTTAAIDEPIVTITLSAGCPPRLTQKLVAFADPPQLSAAAPSAPPLASAEAVAAAPAAAPRASAPRRSAPVARRAGNGAGAASPSRTTPGADGAAASATAGNAASGASRAAAPAPAPSTRRAAAGPRLRLEEPETPAAGRAESPAAARPDSALVQAAAASVAAAESRAHAAEAAATAAQAAALAANQRLQALEGELALLRKEAQANRETMNAMRGRVANDGLSARLMPWLLGLLALLAAAALWLGLRLRKVMYERDTAWYRGAVDSAPTNVRDSELEAASALMSDAGTTEQGVFDVRGRPGAAPTKAVRESVTVPGALAAQPVSALPSAPVPLAAPERRDVTVEEQIDLEQQADFFIVLGQDEAATDLLLAHLRGTGGGSPMPYLKLLQIYRRRSDREAYERTRVRFNQRFNGVAPEWGTDLDAGRTLEDYPHVMARLQHAWWSPLDAMAELESMLFRKGEGAELFDLPAYEEVLFLYQLARDLLQHQREKQEVPDTEVDVLLPLSDADEAHDGVSVRHVDVETTQVLHPRPERGEMPLDLDLSESVEPTVPTPAPPPRRPHDDDDGGELRLSSDFLSLDDAPPPSPSRR